MPPTHGKLYLSHAHADKREAQALRRALEDNGVAVWEDVLELRLSLRGRLESPGGPPARRPSA